ncbi:MAG: glycosyl hydrolase family 28 protein [Phycisphaeraceae bacterium JB051]
MTPSMRNYLKTTCLLLSLLLVSCVKLSVANEKTFINIFSPPSDPRVKASPYYTLSIQNKPVFVYDTYRQDKNSKQLITGCPVSPLAFSIFDFSGKVQVKLQLKDGILQPDKTPVIRPLATNIKPIVDGNTVTITLDKPGNYTFDPRGDGYCALHLFTNMPEDPQTDIPDPNDPNVIYFGPGVHEIESLDVKSNQTLYVAGGAVLLCKPTKTRGTYKKYGIELQTMALPIQIQNAKNVTVRGRGIISCAGNIEHKKRLAPMRLRYLENLTIKDVVLLESSGWNINLQACRNVNIDNLRIVSFYVNSDGICATTNCQNIKVTNSFVHNADDSLEIKSMDSFWGAIPADADTLFGPCRDIVFENCLVWNDLATPIGITHEIGKPIENATFRNITVIHHTSKTSAYQVRGQISIFPSGGGSVRNVTFENITVEQATSDHPFAISINNTHERWHNNIPKHFEGRPYSTIQNVRFKNININTKHPTIKIKNWSDTRSDIDVHFQNVTINNQKLTQSSDLIRNQNAGYQVHD